MRRHRADHDALKDADCIELKNKYPRLTVVNREVKGMRPPCFSVDHFEAGKLAARAFLAQGHRKIAVISGLQTAPDNRERLQNFIDELTRAGIARDDVTIANADFTAAGGWVAAEALLQQKVDFTALFCCNDQLAMAAMSCLQAAGKTVPGDVSVIGYDDADIASFLSPRLTTVHIAIGRMGMNACRLLMNMCYATELDVSREFSPELMMRESLGPAPV